MEIGGQFLEKYMNFYECEVYQNLYLTDCRDYNLINQKYIKIVLHKGQSIVNNFFLETWILVNITPKSNHLMSESQLVRRCDHKCRMETET